MAIDNYFMFSICLHPLTDMFWFRNGLSLCLLCFRLSHTVGIYMKDSLHKIAIFSSEVVLVVSHQMRTTSLNLKRAESCMVRFIVN